MYVELNHFIKSTNHRTALLIGILIFLGVVSVKANAVVIDFDNRPVIPGYFYDNALTNEYESLGLIIEGGYLSGRTNPDGTYDNHLLAGNNLMLTFTGALPTFLSMYVSSHYGSVVSLTALGPEGYRSSHRTSGWAGPHDDTPYLPNQYVSFTSPTGISSLGVSDFFGMRTGATIDNLTIEHHAIVPEPSSLILLLAGCLGIIWRHQRTRNNRNPVSSLLSA